MKKLLKLFFTTLGIAILLACIMQEVDGVGRFAMILSGTVFTYIGSYIKA